MSRKMINFNGRAKEKAVMAWARQNGWEIVGRFIYNGQLGIRLKRGVEKVLVYPKLEAYREEGRLFKDIEERLKGNWMGDEHGESI